ncbi:MAG: hypothetical protein GXP56_10415 [Deltaproteobacteria bacterium]|nr:hypothetical protein [Deltaproteobacteria bacterium]
MANKTYLNSFLKQPYEVLPISIDFSANMEPGETIDLGNSTVAAINIADGEDVAATILENSSLAVVDDTKLTVLVKGGSDKNQYEITLRAYISATKKLEEDIRMIVRD